MIYKLFIRRILFFFNPEFSHDMVLSFLKFIFHIPGVYHLFCFIYCVQDKSLEREVFGLNFKNPVGLAAGFDKNAKVYNEFSAFGFGFIEIGTVTPVAQLGNDKPRLFRLQSDNALINRMGFNNDGIETVVERLKKKYADIIIGGNIGKNKITKNIDAKNDYLICFEKLFDYVDYFVVNVSSPNTPGLRELQEKEPLTLLLNNLQEKNNLKIKRKPILLKIAPDLSNDQLDDIIEIINDTKIDGVIATNTTIDRKNLISDTKIITKIGNGGVSGKPLNKRSTEVIKYLHQKSNNSFPIIGVGGIHSAEDALEKINAGASLVQLYTGFIYEGPALIKKINKLLLK